LVLDRIDTLRTQIIARPPTANARVQNPGQSSTQVNEEARYHLVEAVTAGTRFRDGTVNIRNLIDQLIDTPSPVVRWEVIRLDEVGDCFVIFFGIHCSSSLLQCSIR
jgi:hypothetical protein